MKSSNGLLLAIALGVGLWAWSRKPAAAATGSRQPFRPQALLTRATSPGVPITLGARTFYVQPGVQTITSYLPGGATPRPGTPLPLSSTPLTPSQVIAMSGLTVPRQGAYAGVPGIALTFAEPVLPPLP